MWRDLLVQELKKYCIPVALLGLLVATQTAYALPEWMYGVPITITNNSSSTLTDYQVLLELDTQTPITQGKMRTDGGDVRFATDWDGTMLIDYWIESGINTPDTRIWVQVPSLPASSTTIIYLLYGNPNAASQSDFANTFPNRYQLTSGSDTLGGTQAYDWFEVSSGATLNIQDGQMLTVQARVIRVHGTIDGSAAGYDGARTAPQSNGSGPGFGYGSYYNGGGAGYGGQGGCAPGYNAASCANPRGASYGTTAGPDVDLGSGGGTGRSAVPGNRGGDGGGAVWFKAEVVEVTGFIRVNGEDGVASSTGSYGGGGGSGGGVLIEGGQVNLSGAALSARGGRAGNQYGGAGGGGRIKVFYSESMNGTYSTDVAGETTHTYGGTVRLLTGQGLDGTTFEGMFTSTEPTVSIGSEMVLNDLTITKTVTPATVEPGQPLTYTLTFSKTGPVTATNVLITDIIPVTLTNPGFVGSGATVTPTVGVTYAWQVQDLAPGQGGIITITGVLSTGLPAGAFTNTAAITNTEVDADITNNASMIEATVANVAPIAVDDNASTSQDTAVTIHVRDNDSDLNDDPLTIIAVGTPPNGTASTDGATVTYTPAPGFSSTDSFTYTISDGSLTATATVTVTVGAVNHAPQFTSTPVVIATEGQVYIYAITASDEDAGDVLTITAPARPAWLTLTDNGDGTAMLSGTPAQADVGDHNVVLQVTDGTDTVSQPFTITVYEKSMTYVYLPLVFKNYVVAPDLVVDSIVATGNGVQVVIKNQGNAPATDAFWVDVYVSPDPAPTAANQTWDQLGNQGLVWGVSATLLPGGTITLNVNGAYYRPDYSQVFWPLPVNTPIYAQVDSYDERTTYGAVLESHEITGGTYNNISGPVLSAGRFGTVGREMSAGHVITDSRSSYRSLPPR